jgi:8-amino-7-oxononanoate synthase
LSGGTTSHSALERRFATHFNGPGASADTALLFNSGWEANVSFFSTVPQPDDWIVYDELVHASVHSGMRASRVPVRRRRAVKHSDVEDLKNVLAEIAGTAANDAAASSTKGQVGTGTVFLALESLYSMDGDFCPLPQFLDTFDRYVPKERQCVVLDEAHSTGVYGAGGRGIVSALRYEDRVAVRLMTFGKAVGSSGGTSIPSAFCIANIC